MQSTWYMWLFKAFIHLLIYSTNIYWICLCDVGTTADAKFIRLQNVDKEIVFEKEDLGSYPSFIFH